MCYEVMEVDKFGNWKIYTPTKLVKVVSHKFSSSNIFIIQIMTLKM